MNVWINFKGEKKGKNMERKGEKAMTERGQSIKKKKSEEFFNCWVQFSFVPKRKASQYMTSFEKKKKKKKKDFNMLIISAFYKANLFNLRI